MLRSVNDLAGYSIEASDGEIGSVVEFYFDDENWTVRYLVAHTGGWLMGRKVLISPAALGDVDWESKRLWVNMTKQRVQDSPDIDTDKPVSRQQEMKYYDYYNYPYYWGGPYLWGPVGYPRYAAAYPAAAPSTVKNEIDSAARNKDDVHLRSTREVTGYYIDALDGDIGHVDDFLIDDETWTIRYLVVDTKNWWPGKKVLISPEWIRSVSWSETKVFVDLSREAIKNGPEYNPSDSPGRDYEKHLYEHHHHPDYLSE